MKGNLEIHSENILPIIKKWLYSDRDIFVRELVSNACDACEKLKVMNIPGPFSIDVRQNKEKGTIEFEDNGIGMTEEEVKKYIAQIAFSGAEEFVEHYKTQLEGDQLIGHFGLGFYSSYMVASHVEIETLSYKEGSVPVTWSCDGSIEYQIKPGERKTRGTLVRLNLTDDAKDYLEESKLKDILKKYCKFLMIPIFLNGEQINTHEPLWVKNPRDCTKEEYISFYHYLYPHEEDPLFWIHLNVDYPFHLKGILYFPKLKSVEFQKLGVQLFCNRVFVTDNLKDVLPDYLSSLRGVIDSPDIPLNVSRSYLQLDKTVKQLSSHISKKVSDSLIHLYQEDREKYISYWDHIGPIMKIGSLQDEKFFERVNSILIFKKTDGSFITLEEYPSKKVFYTKDPNLAPLVLNLYKQKGLEVLIMNSPLDPYLINFFEQKSTFKFQRIDGGIDDSLIDKEKEKVVLDEEGKSEASKIAQFFQSNLDEVNVEAKSLSGEHLPGLVLFEENTRRLRDYMQVIDPKSQAAYMLKPTFVVNTNNTLIESIYRLGSKNPDLSKELAQEVYDLSLLGQKEMDQNSLTQFIERSHHVLEKLIKSLEK